MISIRDSNPTFKYHISKGLDTSKTTFGFENECAIKSLECEETEHLINRYKKNREYFLKYDGSVCVNNYFNGVEINSHPFDWNWFQKHKRGFLSLFENLPRKNVKVNGTCGFHIHISRATLSTTQVEKMKRFFFDPKNRKWLRSISHRISQRTLNEYASFKQNEYSERHVAFNTSNRNTVEIRFFQGTVNPELIQGYLEFAHALVQYTKSTPYTKLSSKLFRQYIKRHTGEYPYLFKMVKRRLKV